MLKWGLDEESVPAGAHNRRAHLPEGGPLLLWVVDIVLVDLVCEEHKFVLGAELEQVHLVLVAQHLLTAAWVS